MVEFPYKIPRNSRSDASPSVTLEKGAYRIRAPSAASRLRPPVQKSGRPNSLIILIALLLLACFVSFSAAYYLFTTRWDLVIRQVHTQSTDALPQVISYNESIPSFGPDEKFLTYLSHSGFHNQRIAFENAITLSNILNRTLLVPPIRLGTHPIRYVNFDALQRFLALSGKEGLFHCSHTHSTIPTPTECLGTSEYTHIPWDWLVNLTQVSTYQPLLFRWDLSREWIFTTLGISQADTLILKDSHPYHFCFLDSLNDTSSSTSKFKEDLYIDHLTSSSQRLIQIGTLFGSSRLRLKQHSNAATRTLARSSMVFSNPVLNTAASAISDWLSQHYLGAHIRLGDGQFQLQARTTTRNLWWKLVHNILGFTLDEVTSMEKTLNASRPLNEAFPGQYSMTITPERFHSRCHGTLHKIPQLARLNTPLFISTDLKDAIHEPTFSTFVRTFPCVFFLSDFQHVVSTLDRVVNGYDGLVMKEFLLPFLDAMVVAHADQIVVTPGSTFSQFIEDVLWRRYHNLDILERG